VTIRVATAEQRSASYDILIGRGLFAELPGLVQAACPAARYAVITDSDVATLYGEKLVARCHDATVQAELFAFPAGEASKTRETWASLSDRLLQRQFGRDCGVIALGGGVVGDVAGFVAATYLRGVPYIQVPTTLLAMIDSSIGGKTGVDVPAGKNLLGAFHQPRLVVADLDLLRTLPAPQLAAGIAEAVKHGAVADADYFAFLEREHDAVTTRQPEALERLVRRSVEIKADVVAADERETGRRAILNFGHTVAHAVEARLAELLGIAAAGTAQRIGRLLERYGLPLALPEGATAEQLLATMRLDKKARAGTVRFALPETVGRMHADGSSWTVAAPEGIVREVLAAG